MHYTSTHWTYDAIRFLSDLHVWSSGIEWGWLAEHTKAIPTYLKSCCSDLTNPKINPNWSNFIYWFCSNVWLTDCSIRVFQFHVAFSVSNKVKCPIAHILNYMYLCCQTQNNLLFHWFINLKVIISGDLWLLLLQTKTFKVSETPSQICLWCHYAI